MNHDGKNHQSKRVRTENLRAIDTPKLQKSLGAGIAPVHHLPEFLEDEPLPPHQTVFDVPFMKVLDEVKRR
jgi:hypothetical protein